MIPNISKSLFSVEWNSSVRSIQSQLLPAATHFVLPDLPNVISKQEQLNFISCVQPNQRIHTIATCHYDNHVSLINKVSQLLENDNDPVKNSSSKILLVGGNEKTSTTMSTIEATKILQNEFENELFGVANPNDFSSVVEVEKKIQAGIKGIITQPLLSSDAMDNLHAYREICQTYNPNNKEVTTKILAGVALPTSANSLQFWSKLVGQELELQKDPLFQSHLAFFSQPYYTSIAWIGKEVHKLLMLMSITGQDENGQALDGVIDGIHFMPLKNTEDLCTMFQSLNANIQHQK